jgi:hypothetical protein
MLEFMDEAVDIPPCTHSRKLGFQRRTDLWPIPLLLELPLRFYVCRLKSACPLETDVGFLGRV